MSSSHHEPKSRPARVLASSLAIARKELVEGFRDRQTLLYTFVLPLCMYPALFWVMVQGALVVQGQKGAKDVTVALVAAPGDVAEASQAVGDEPERGGRTAVEPVDLELSEDPVAYAALLDSDASDAPDAVLVLPPERGDGRVAHVVYDSTDSRSEIARERIERSLSRWSGELRAKAAEARSLDPDALDPIVVNSTSVAEKKDEGALVLSLMLPMLLVVMCVLGAFFPAVDLTAGEKERRTVETTMLLPVPRLSVHLGKIFAVCAASMIATTLNLLALGLSAGHLLGQLSALGEGGLVVQLPVRALAAVAPLAVLFAFFVSAALTGVASLAASFKEGQALLGPVQMVFILPAIAASLPGIELDLATAWVPVVNVALAFRGLLVGDVETLPLLVCALALLLAAAAAIWFSVRLLSNEEVALSGETLPMGRLLRLLRTPRAES